MALLGEDKVVQKGGVSRGNWGEFWGKKEEDRKFSRGNKWTELGLEGGEIRGKMSQLGREIKTKKIVYHKPK